MFKNQLRSEKIALLLVCMSLIGIKEAGASKIPNSEVSGVGNLYWARAEMPDSTKKPVRRSSVALEDEEAYFPGGYEVYFAQHFKMPRKARKAGVKGRLVVKFLVNKEGKVEVLNVVEGLTPEVNREAIKVLENMPAWTPGKVEGVPVNSMHQLTVNLE